MNARLTQLLIATCALALPACVDSDENIMNAPVVGDMSTTGQIDAGAVDQGPAEQPDTDGDGVADDTDNCADVANAGQEDDDLDGVGDVCDDDDDNDGVSDADDCAPLNAMLGGCTLLYADRDGDMFGDPGDSECVCAPTDVYRAATAMDCDDAQADVNPDAAEACDAADQDCDGRVDEDADCVDDDPDGDLVRGDADNCPDLANPGQADHDRDGLGDACDPDDDNDGVPDDDDNCDFVVNPDQTDTFGNGRGDACDDDWDSDGVLNAPDNCRDVPNPDQMNSDGDADGDACDVDDDNDGDLDVTDCAPLDPAVHSAAVEQCNGVDNDCDGAIDDGEDAVGCTPFYPDADGDGFGDAAAAARCLCGPDGIWSAQTATDCDDAVAAVNPDAEELCNGRDDDCNDVVDELWPDAGTPCDGDDADACTDGVRVCAADGRSTICDDGPATPNAAERCNGADDDCDGRVDEEWPDLGDACDGDDSDQCLNGRIACRPDGAGTECRQDLPANIRESCDDQDNDCDGRTDEGFERVIEICNGIDDNCNGAVDDRVRGEGAVCNVAGQQGLCRTGANRCRGARFSCEQTVFAADETCDGRDEDCDGETDESGPAPARDVYEFNDIPAWVPGPAVPSAGMSFRTGRDGETTTPARATNLGAEGVDCFRIVDAAPWNGRFFTCRVTTEHPDSRFRLQLGGKAGGDNRWITTDRSGRLESGEWQAIVVPGRGLPGTEYGVCVTRAAGFGACFADYELECALSRNPNFWQQ